jgi:hypothetical protein
VEVQGLPKVGVMKSSQVVREGGCVAEDLHLEKSHSGRKWSWRSKKSQSSEELASGEVKMPEAQSSEVPFE